LLTSLRAQVALCSVILCPAASGTNPDIFLSTWFSVLLSQYWDYPDYPDYPHKAKHPVKVTLQFTQSTWDSKVYGFVIRTSYTFILLLIL